MNGVSVNRPGRNGTYIHFIDATMNDTEILAYDCGWSPNVTYSGSNLIIYARYPWVYGHQYYITFDSGKIRHCQYQHFQDSCRNSKR